MFKKLDEAKGNKDQKQNLGGASFMGANLKPIKQPKFVNAKLKPAKKAKYVKEDETMNDSVRNIITAAIEDNSVEVQSSIHTAIGEKIKDALEAKRVVVAQNLVGIGEAVSDAGIKAREKRLAAKKDENKDAGKKNVYGHTIPKSGSPIKLVKKG